METLAEMLDVTELTKAAPKAEDDAKTDDNDTNMKAAVIVASALDASHALARQNPQGDLSVVTEAIQRFSKTDPQKLKDAHIPTRIVSDAEHLLNVLKKE
jgi:hypothetical protein